MNSVRACRVGDVRDGSALRCELDGHAVCVARIGEEWFAIGDVCSHADFSLGDGEVWADEYEIECPKHGSRYDLDGKVLKGPSKAPLAKFAATLDGERDRILVVLED